MDPYSSPEGCQNYGPFLGTLYIRGRIIIGTQKGTIILITTHIIFNSNSYNPFARSLLSVREQVMGFSVWGS